MKTTLVSLLIILFYINSTLLAQDKTLFNYNGQKDWKSYWFLDGEKARVVTEKNGLALYAGDTFMDHSSHTVLWTQNSFKGDIQIDYDYTRLDETKKCVNIIYIHAKGTGEKGFEQNIKLWKDKRKEPYMHLYFNHMNAYHISYAAFGMKNEDPSDDYIRMRRYQPLKVPFIKSALKEEYFKTDLFKPFVTYHITIKVRQKELEMQVSNADQKKTFKWSLLGCDRLNEGRIGLRHMFTRNAHYAHFKVTSL